MVRDSDCGYRTPLGLVMPAEDLPSELPAPSELSGKFIERGGSAVIGPDANYVVEPVFDREELIVADLDLTQIDREAMTLDVSGRYARPDIFQFSKKALACQRLASFCDHCVITAHTSERRVDFSGREKLTFQGE